MPTYDFQSEILRPNGTGDLNQIVDQYPVSGAHWDKVDDESYDGDSTYVITKAQDWERDLYTIPVHSEGSGTILSVTVFMVCRAAVSPSQTSASALIGTNGGVYYGAEQLVTTDYASYSHQWDTNPDTNEAWTWDEIDALQIGVRLRQASNNKDTICTQVYVSVNYKVAVIEGETPSGDLFVATPHADYTGDLLVEVYLINTSALIKAYRYLNMKLYLEGSVEAGETPNYRLLTLGNGVATFSLDGGSGDTHTLSVIGGSYQLVSLDPSTWGEGWSIAPEFYCEVTQR